VSTSAKLGFWMDSAEGADCGVQQSSQAACSLPCSGYIITGSMMVHPHSSLKSSSLAVKVDGVLLMSCIAGALCEVSPPACLQLLQVG
jgi:hypothetical protein